MIKKENVKKKKRMDHSDKRFFKVPVFSIDVKFLLYLFYKYGYEKGVKLDLNFFM